MWHAVKNYGLQTYPQYIPAPPGIVAVVCHQPHSYSVDAQGNPRLRKNGKKFRVTQKKDKTKNNGIMPGFGCRDI